MKLPEQFLHTLLFCTEREAQRRIDTFYPGWKVKVTKDSVGLIYDPNGKLVHRLRST